MDMITKLRELLRADMKSQVPVQTVWATCKSVSMAQGTMVATADGIDYNDVLIGLGGDLLEPTANSRVLLGLVMNKRQATFLIATEQTSRRWINGNAHGGLTKADSVTNKLNAIAQDINTLKQLFTVWSPVSMDGGAALKVSTAVWAADMLVLTVSNELQNDTVSHG